MPPIRVITDSTCDLPEALVRQYNITVVPVNVHLGGQVYLDRVTITTDEYLRLAVTTASASPEPCTSAPSVAVFEQVFRQIARERSADGIVAIHVAAGL